MIKVICSAVIVPRGSTHTLLGWDNFFHTFNVVTSISTLFHQPNNNNNNRIHRAVGSPKIAFSSRSPCTNASPVRHQLGFPFTSNDSYFSSRERLLCVSFSFFLSHSINLNNFISFPIAEGLPPVRPRDRVAVVAQLLTVCAINFRCRGPSAARVWPPGSSRGEPARGQVAAGIAPPGRPEMGPNLSSTVEHSDGADRSTAGTYGWNLCPI